MLLLSAMQTMTITIEMTIATMGRLIKNLAITIYLGSEFAVRSRSTWADALSGLGLTMMPAWTF